MKTAQFLTKVKPGVLAIIIIVIALILYFLFKKKNNTTTQTAVDSITINPNKLQFTTAELEFKTSQILDAMDRLGTDTDTIMSVLNSLHNGDELLYIIKSFGVKPYYIAGLADTWDMKMFASDENLIGWFHEELSDTELAEVKAVFDKLGVNML